ncbi:MAG: AI-2E family transporter [Alphaproteobacteria bacterium]
MITVQSQVRFWLIAFALFIFVIWVLSPILLPFVAGMAIAYFLNPAVNYLERQKPPFRMPRWLGTTLVLLAFILFAVLILTLTIPLIQSQIGAFINAVPGYIQKVHVHYIPWVENWLSRFAPEDVEKLRTAATQSATEVTGWVAGLMKQMVSGGFAIIDIIAVLVLTPVVAFYMLRDWPQMTHTIDSLLPRRYYDVIHSQLYEIDNTLSGFIRGQALVCVALSLIYSIGLTIAGLDYGATIGIVAGILSFIPYVGTTFGWLTSLLLAMVQFDNDWSRIGLVMVVFLIGQALEGYILIPRLVGNRVGLHAVWVVFAMMAGGQLMGFTGVLIAVPVAAVIGVLTRFAIRQYKASPVYKDSL